MSIHDASLPADGRLYAFRNYNSVFPMPEWGSLEEWKREREKVQRHLWLCSGLNDQTRAFRAKGKVVKTFRHEGLVVENIRIETLPGFYVMGNLYRPEKPQGKLPLILDTHGHGMNNRTTPLPLFSVPHRGTNQALLGFAAFAWAMVGTESDMMQVEHRSLLQGKEKEICNVMGLSMFGLQLNNSMKVLDYLCSREDIDGSRVGCTGESGGGTQTYYLAAADERVRVAAPAVMLSGHMQGGCVCENAPLLHLKYSTVHYAALIAPRPLLLTACTGDWTHHAMEREYASLKKLYGLYGKEEAIDCFYQDEKHNYNQASRERVYAWMARWLQDREIPDARIPESEKPAPEREKLLVYETPVPPLKNAISSQEELIGMWRRLRPDAGKNTAGVPGLEDPEASDLLIRNMTPRYAYGSRVLAQNRIDYGRFSEDSSLTCRFVLPKRGRPLLVLLQDWNEDNPWQGFVEKPPAFVQKAVEAGCGVLVPRLFGQEVSDTVRAYREAVEASYLFTSFNRTADLHRTGDVVTTVRLAGMEFGVPASRISIVADKGMGLVAFAAWAFLCSRMKMGPLVADLPRKDLTEPATWVEYAYLPLALRAGGVKDLVRLCERRKAFLSGVRRQDRKLFGKGFQLRERSLSLKGLVEEAVRMG